MPLRTDVERAAQVGEDLAALLRQLALRPEGGHHRRVRGHLCKTKSKYIFRVNISTWVDISTLRWYSFRGNIHGFTFYVSLLFSIDFAEKGSITVKRCGICFIIKIVHQTYFFLWISVLKDHMVLIMQEKIHLHESPRRLHQNGARS